jgi:hypothetical protein
MSVSWLAAIAVLSLTIGAQGGNPPPSITALDRTAGSTYGGATVVITGANFLRGATVWFGESPSSSITFNNSASITAVAPPSTLRDQEGTVAVTIVNPDGQRAKYTIAQGGFIYHLPPSIKSVTRTDDTPEGGGDLAIKGQHFRSTFRGVTQLPEVHVGGELCSNVYFVSDSELTCTLAAGNSESRESVSVVNPDGQSTVLGNSLPTRASTITISSVEPRGGPPAGGTSVTITGNGTSFQTGASVTFGSVASTSVTVSSATKIIAVAPKQAKGDVAITVQNPSGGQTVTKSAAYNYTLGPIINSISPTTGPAGGGTAVTVTGSNLNLTNAFTFGSVAATITKTSASQLTVTAPAGSAGTVNVEAKSASQGNDILYNAFNYTGSPVSIVTQGFDDAYPNIAYSEQLVATGGKPPYNWSIVSGSLPSGITLAANGLVSGQAAANYNTYTVTFEVKDSSSPATTAQLSLSFNVVFGFQPGPIPESFFGMTLFLPTDVPTIPFGSLAKPIGVAWPFIEQVKGQFNWALLDQYVALAESLGIDVYVTTANTPPWAVPDLSTCSVYPSFPGIFGCTAMVKNIQDWNDFITEMVTRYKGRIKMYELWNEPNVANTFTGTIEQMVQLTQEFHNIVRQIDPAALIGAPSSTSEPYQQEYYAEGGTTDFDVITVHGYPNVGEDDVPEAIVGFKSVNTKLLMASLGLANKLFWDDESSWGGTNSNPDLLFRAAFASRSLLEHWSVGSTRFYWYAYDSPAWGTLWSPGGVNEDGMAYYYTYKWMIGATMPAPCTQNGGTTYAAIYTCTLTRSGGYQALAVWDTTEPCSQTGGCPTHPYTPPAGVTYTQYRDIFGNVTSISGDSVPIGAEPILLETSNPPS